MTLVPTNPAVKKIAGANVILGVAFTALAGILWGPRGTLAAGVGAILACADFLLLARIGAKAIAAVRTGGAPWGLGLALFAKMTGLFVLVFAALRVAKLAMMPFALGFSALVVSILLVGMAGGAIAIQKEKKLDEPARDLVRVPARVPCPARQGGRGAGTDLDLADVPDHPLPA